MKRRDSNAETQTHAEIVKPLAKRDDVFAALDAAQDGQKRWREAFPDPDEPTWGPCPMR